MLNSVENMVYDGIDLSDRFSDGDDPYADYLIINNVSGRGIFGVENALIDIPARAGALHTQSRINPRYLSAVITVKGDSAEHLRQKVDGLTNVMHARYVAVPISFSDEPNLTYYGRIGEVEQLVETDRIYQAEITFVCEDPYKYSQETSTIIYEPNSEESSIVTLFADQKHEFETNESSINALPIFNVEFSASTSKFELFHRQSRRRLTVAYDFEAGDTLTLNARNRRVQINGNTRMPALSKDSAWFDLISGDNSFEVTGGVATVTLRYRTRWL